MTERDGEECFCPRCGGDIADYPDCPGYTQGGRRVVCMPACGNAWRFFCAADNDCEWNFTWGLGKQSSQYAANEADRPPWLVGDYPY